MEMEESRRRRTFQRKKERRGSGHVTGLLSLRVKPVF